MLRYIIGYIILWLCHARAHVVRRRSIQKSIDAFIDLLGPMPEPTSVLDKWRIN